MMNLIHHNKALWTLQVLLAAVYLFAGPFKVLASAEAFGPPGPLPIWFLRFVGVLETLGALGLILPGLTGIRRGATPIAAACLIVIMCGATVVTVMTMSATAALIPVIVGILDAVVVIGRRDWLVPRGAAAQRTQVVRG